ncbi:MAG: nucleotidyl transferase AbiEii/AbiGii toxin family protein [Candidatus Berkiella sp.]
MIPLAEINNFSQRLKVPSETIEKDYVISWVLFCLSQSLLKNDFIFYGGTAIKRIYFDDHRFSEDIDLLSTKKFDLDTILKALNCLKYAQDEANILLTINRDNIIVVKDRIQMYVNYFGYDEIVGAPKEIRLDFAMNMDLYGKVIYKPVIETYSDFKKINAKLSVMTVNTILANKLGLLLDRTRNEPRDLFDIWFLLLRLDEFDYDFEQVCEAFKSKYGFRLSAKIILPNLKNVALKNNWSIRLSKQMPVLPDISVVVKDVEQKLKELFFEEFKEDDALFE